MSSYSGIIRVDLTKLGEQQITVNRADRLWLPKFVGRGGVVFANPTDAVLQIRFSEDGGEGDVWAIKDGYRNTESGLFSQIFVTVLTPGAGSQIYFMTGRGIEGGYASSDGLSPSIGAGAPQSDPAAFYAVNQIHQTHI